MLSNKNSAVNAPEKNVDQARGGFGFFRANPTGNYDRIRGRITSKLPAMAALITAAQDQDYSGFRELGCVSDEPDEYFKSTPESQQCFARFLKIIFETEEIIRELEQAHLEKLKKYKKQVRPPSCLAFVTMEILKEADESEGRKFCFPILSGRSERDLVLEPLFLRLEEKIREKAGHTFSGHKMIFYQNFSLQYNELIQAVYSVMYPNKTYTEKLCIEKKLAALFSKLLADYGPTVRVTGVSNYAFYPFFRLEDEAGFKFQACYKEGRIAHFEIDKIVHHIPEIKCCLDCQNNKLPIFMIMLDALQAAKERAALLENPLKALPETREQMPVASNQKKGDAITGSLLDLSVKEAIGSFFEAKEKWPSVQALASRVEYLGYVRA
jgi:hypothetical protein